MNRSRHFVGWTLAALLGVLWLSGCQKEVPSNHDGVTGGGEAETADSTVRLVAGHGPQPRTQKLSASREEAVWWQNDNDRGHTIRFTREWPFREPQEDILVKAGHKSAVYHVYKNQAHERYAYRIRPLVPGDSDNEPSQTTSEDPSDPPVVEVGP